VTAPLGRAISRDSFLGESSPSVGLKAIVDGRAGRFFYGVNAGGLLRKQASLGSLDLGPEARLGIGAGYEVTPRARVLVEAFGSTNFTGSAGTNASEVDGAVQVSPAGSAIQITLGGGGGLNQGLGAPTFRVFAGMMMAFERAAVVETRRDEHPDRDGDGIPDSEDACPSEGGDVVRTPGRYLGCPHRDSDGDGIADSQDACPEQAGIKTADPKTNGCPDPDRDHDGIPNDIDKCPDLPETVNGIDDADGCPDTVPIQVEVRRDSIVVINEKINFEFRSERIVGPRSFEALDLVAQVMKEHPEIRRVEVAGHTDNVGPREENQSLSERRAGSVVAYLAGKGVARDRLIARGYGTDQPLADNGTEEGRGRNRRVEFKILVMAKLGVGEVHGTASQFSLSRGIVAPGGLSCLDSLGHLHGAPGVSGR
jgi:outer membrane protein OmpA-like peptidoglycan-associated protein